MGLLFWRKKVVSATIITPPPSSGNLSHVISEIGELNYKLEELAHREEEANAKRLEAMTKLTATLADVISRLDAVSASVNALSLRVVAIETFMKEPAKPHREVELMRDQLMDRFKFYENALNQFIASKSAMEPVINIKVPETKVVEIRPEAPTPQLSPAAKKYLDGKRLPG